MYLPDPPFETRHAARVGWATVVLILLACGIALLALAVRVP